MTMCENCKREMIELLDERTRRILEVFRQETTDDARGIGEAHCFHLMELKRILRGEPTCGVYDDHGPRKQEAAR